MAIFPPESPRLSSEPACTPSWAPAARPRRDYGRRHPLPERIHVGPPGRETGSGRAADAHGHQRQEPYLRSGRPCSRQAINLCRNRRHRRCADEGSALLRRRYTYVLRDPDPADGQGTLRRKHPPGEGTGCEGEVLVGQSRRRPQRKLPVSKASYPRPDTQDIVLSCYFRYSESFFKSSGIGGNGGHSCEGPLSNGVETSERRVPSSTANLCG